MSLYEVVEDEASYKDVCDRNSSSTAKNIRNAFSGLRCPAERLHEWNAQSKNYTKKFVRAKQCMQRRITRMKKFTANTEQQKEMRRKHIYPIEVAYTYGKNCARKIGTLKNVNDFTRSTNALLAHVSESQQNASGSAAAPANNGIPKSLNTKIQKNHRDLHAIAKTPYYSPEQWNIINKYREGSTNGEVLTAYNSIIDSDLQKLGYALVPNTNAVAENASSAASAASAASAPTTNAAVKPNRKRTRRVKKLTATNAANTANEQNLNAFVLSSMEHEEHKYMLFDQMVANWYIYIDARNALAMCNYFAHSVQDTMDTCVAIIKSFPESKRTLNKWFDKNTSLLMQNDKRLQLYMTHANSSLNTLNKTIEHILQITPKEELMHYIQDIDGLCSALYELADDRLFDIAFTDEDLDRAKQLQTYNNFIKSSFKEMYAKQKSLIAYIIEQNNVKTVIEMKKYTQENAIGKQFYEKLNDTEEKKMKAYDEVLQIIASRTNTIEEYASLIPQMRHNSQMMSQSIKRLEGRIYSVELFNPDTYY